MENKNHINKAGESFTKGTANAQHEAAQGRMLDAAESAWEGTATAATELAKSTADSVRSAVNKAKSKG